MPENLLNTNEVLDEQNELYLCLVYFANKIGLKISPIEEFPPFKDINQYMDALCKRVGLQHRRINLAEHLAKIDLEGTIVFHKDTGKAYMVESSFWGPQRFVDITTGKTFPFSLKDVKSYGFFIYRPYLEEKLRFLSIIRSILNLSKKDIYGFIIFIAITDAIMLSVPIFTGVILDWAVPYADYSLLTQIFLSLVLATILIYFANLGETNIFSRIKARSTIHGQLGIWSRVLSFPLNFFRQYEVGDLSLRVKGLDLIQNQISFSIISLFSGILFTVAGLIVISIFSLLYAFLIFLIGLFLGALFFYTSYKQLVFTRVIQQYQAKIQSLLYQVIVNIHKIKIAKAERRVNSQWKQIFFDKVNFTINAQTFFIIFQMLNSFLLLLSMIIIYVFVFQAENISFGISVMLISLSFQLMTSITGWISVLSGLVKLMPYYERMRPILEQKPEEMGTLLEADLKGEIDIENISFSYEGSRQAIIQNLSLHIHPGQFVALIGPSGGGKSTLLRLMLGLEKLTEGHIYIGNIPLTQINLHNFRSQVGVVLQRPSFIPGNIRDNLTLFEQKISQDQVWKALEEAGIKDEIASLPMGLLTLVSELGRTFSSGQMQRLMIARALIKNPKILFFDEPTSALDSISQQKIVETLNKLPITKIIVTHRISTIREADIIYVIEKGRVLDQGTFGSLQKNSKFFQNLLDLN